MEVVTFQVVDIVRGTTVDGPGFRTAIYLAGCNHKCEGCHNPQTWNPRAGKTMTLQEIAEIVAEEDFDVTITGGDPLYNPESTAILAKEIHRMGYSIWLYTGYTINQIRASGRLSKVLPYLDCIVDGAFIKELYDSDLLFRGSSNQKIIPLK